MASLFINLLLVFYVGLAYTCGTMTYNTRTFKENMKQAFQKAKSGEQVLITRHDETFVLVERNRYLDSLPANTDVTIPAIDPQFRLVLEDDLKPKMVIDPRELRERMGKPVIDKGAK